MGKTQRNNKPCEPSKQKKYRRYCSWYRSCWSICRFPERSAADREVLLVTEGLLARESERGRLEFRYVLGDTTLIAALHDFVPRLPWWVYRLTQGTLHRWVMKSFARHLARLSAEAPTQTGEVS